MPLFIDVQLLVVVLPVFNLFCTLLQMDVTEYTAKVLVANFYPISLSNFCSNDQLVKTVNALAALPKSLVKVFEHQEQLDVPWFHIVGRSSFEQPLDLS